MRLETASKPVLFTVAIACLTAGVKLLETDLYTGIILLIIGIALVLAYAYLLERQTAEKATEKVLRKMGEIEGKGSCKSN
jgi:hypothetical protein